MTGFRFLAIKHLPDQLTVGRVWSTIPHGPELPHPEPAPTRADPVLAEEHRPGGVELDGHGNQRDQRSRDDQSHRRSHEIDDPLE